MATRDGDDSSVEPVETTRPVLRVVNGDATPEEVAAIVAVVASLGGGEAAPPRRTPEWSAHHRKVRAAHAHGPGGWRSSGMPRQPAMVVSRQALRAFLDHRDLSVVEVEVSTSSTDDSRWLRRLRSNRLETTLGEAP